MALPMNNQMLATITITPQTKYMYRYSPVTSTNQPGIEKQEERCIFRIEYSIQYKYFLRKIFIYGLILKLEQKSFFNAFKFYKKQSGPLTKPVLVKLPVVTGIKHNNKILKNEMSKAKYIMIDISNFFSFSFFHCLIILFTS